MGGREDERAAVCCMAERIIESDNAAQHGLDAPRSPGTHDRPRIALAHDWLCGYRGGEAVLESIAAIVEQHFDPAPLYVMFDDGRPISPTVDRLRNLGLIRCWPPGTWTR